MHSETSVSLHVISGDVTAFQVLTMQGLLYAQRLSVLGQALVHVGFGAMCCLHLDFSLFFFFFWISLERQMSSGLS